MRATLSAIVDTNVIVAGILSSNPRSASRSIIDQLWEGRFSTVLITRDAHCDTRPHTMRWHAHYHSSTGHLHQGRFKVFPVETDDHFFTVLRYVERHSVPRRGRTE